MPQETWPDDPDAAKGIKLPEEQRRFVRFAARNMGVSETEVVIRAVRKFAEQPSVDVDEETESLVNMACVRFGVSPRKAVTSAITAMYAPLRAAPPAHPAARPLPGTAPSNTAEPPVPLQAARHLPVDRGRVEPCCSVCCVGDRCVPISDCPEQPDDT